MPSVGMRRSTRVFGTRVLRSGRRLWTEPHEGGKNVRAAHGENKFPELLDHSADGGGRHRELWLEDETGALLEVSTEPKMEERETDGMGEKNVDRRFGIVYQRKRKRAEFTTAGIVEDGRFAKKYARKRWRKRCRISESYGDCGGLWYSHRTRRLAIVVNESSYDCYYWVTCFLTTLLSYMTRVRIGIRQLSSFMLSRPMCDAYSSRGMLFLQVFFYSCSARWLLDYCCTCAEFLFVILFIATDIAGFYYCWENLCLYSYWMGIYDAIVFC